jgi:predicted DNA-binding transcriptional regulator YafY
MRAYPTRPAMYRMKEIDDALKKETYPNSRVLAGRMEISPRTVQRDIEYMRDVLGAPIDYDAGKRGYFYTESGYSLPSAKLTEGELVSILVAGKVLNQYAGTPFEADLRRAFKRITSLLSDEVCVHLGDLADATAFAISAPRPADLDLFRKLTEAVRRRRRLRIVYSGLSGGRRAERRVDPYKMACVDGAWYLAAYCHTRREVRLFVPDRIAELSETGETFRTPRDFDFDNYMKTAFGVMRGGKPRRVRLRFTGLAARYVPERKWHATQVVKRCGDACVLEMTVTGLDQVARWAMSFGGECQVLLPKELRTKVMEGHRAGVKVQGGR